jgi:hypothetical protein
VIDRSCGLFYDSVNSWCYTGLEFRMIMNNRRIWKEVALAWSRHLPSEIYGESLKTPVRTLSLQPYRLSNGKSQILRVD